MVCKVLIGTRALTIALMATQIAALVTALAPAPAMARGPATALVGSPCFCARICQSRGVVRTSWIDTTGTEVYLSQCAPALRQEVEQFGDMCTCDNPLDWYTLPPDPRRPPPDPRAEWNWGP